MLILFILISFNSVFAGVALETSSFLEIEKKAMELGKKHGNKNVLMVFDIDNTILTMPQELGSDMWFTWQYNDCIKKKIKSSYCSTNNMGELLSIQGKLFALSNMLPTEPAAPKVISRLQKSGFKVILLTSRGPTYRNATERELNRNGYKMIDHAIGPKAGYPGTFYPYQLNRLRQHGVTKEITKVTKISKPRKISYMNGVMMTAGLNKGLMIKTILTKTGTNNFKAVIFSDDHIKHTKRVQAVMSTVKGLDLVTYRYGKIDPQVKSFKKSKKQSVIRAYNAYKTTVKSIFK